MMGESMENYTLVELRQMAKEKGIKNVSKLKKEELISLLSQDSSTIDSENEDISVEEENIPNQISQSQDGYKLTNSDDQIVEGILEVMPDGYGFLRGKNYLSSPKDVYISPVQIRRFKLDKGDKIKGIARLPKEGEKFPAFSCWHTTLQNVYGDYMQIPSIENRQQHTMEAYWRD